MADSHVFEVEMPDKSILEIEAPENTPIDQIRARARQYVQSHPETSPTLLQSRQQASKSEFEQNLPQSTPFTRARDLVLGGLQGLGMDATPPTTLAQKAAKYIPFAGAAMAGAHAAAHPLDTALSIANGLTAGPTEAYHGYQTGDYNELAHGVGNTIAVDFPAAYGAAKGAQAIGQGVQDLVQRGRVALAGGPEKAIAQNIKPTGTERQTITDRLAPELAAQDPTLARLKQAAYDQKTYQNYQKAKAMLDAAEQSVPAGTTVAKAPMLNELDQEIDAMKVPGQSTTVQQPIVTPGKGVTGFQQQTVQQSLSGHPNYLKVLSDARNELDQFPDQIPFENLRKYRIQLDQAINQHKGWNDTASDIEGSDLAGKQFVANVIRGNQKGISPSLDTASDAYGMAADNMRASGLNPNTGTRLSTVGKPSQAQIAARKAAELLGKSLITGGGLGLGGAAAYEIYHALRGQ